MTHDTRLRDSRPVVSCHEVKKNEHGTRHKAQVADNDEHIADMLIH